MDAGRLGDIVGAEVGARPAQVAAAVVLLDGGATVPFVARYRKEATGGLDDVQLRRIEERVGQLRDLEARRDVVVRSITGQGRMTPELEASLARATTRAEVEDVYLPYRPKRKTRADKAREYGLGPLAEALVSDRKADPAKLAEAYVIPGGEVPDVSAALIGARDVVAEAMAENTALVREVRSHVVAVARVRARVVPGKEAEGEKFKDYFDHAERLAAAPSHRVLALLRARNEGVVTLDVEVDAEDPSTVKPVEAIIARHYGVDVKGRTPSDAWMMGAARWAWRVKVHSHLSVDMMVDMKDRADDAAIRVFSDNLKDLLLAAPAGPKAVLGVDPGIRTGVKLAVVDATGRLVDQETVYPFQPRNDVRGAVAALASLMRRHKVELVAVGNGTASRETQRVVAAAADLLPAPRPSVVIVSEAGASVYSASELASREMPDVDVTIRGAVSIARRLQDPLAELVKIDPKAIGVGQYQHDVDQHRLARALDAVVEDAVNAVGVDLNTASAALLARVSGVGPSLADAIVSHRDREGPFRTRRALLDVSRLGPKAFEQCAGFLRIRDGSEPLDASSVHPESYPVAKRIVEACGRDVRAIMADPSVLKALQPARFAVDGVGLPTVRDIFSELQKPGRDPRPAFVNASFAEGVNDIKDLKPGMELEGVVSNVSDFGAFVDLGVHQDGLVHVSQLADRFVKDPREVVKTGQVVKVRVLEVDVARKRISLTMRRDSTPRDARGSHEVRRPAAAFAQADGAMAAALAAAAAKGKAGKARRPS